MKKVMFLGGSRFQVAPLKYAKAKGYKIILCDWGRCAGEQYADSFHKISTTNLKGIYRVAQKEKPDAVVCYASDPAAVPAAWLCEKLGLPTNPLESVEILANKDLFRNFLHQHGFNIPFYHIAKYSDFPLVFGGYYSFSGPMNFYIIKPTDSSGSRGVSIIERGKNFMFAIEHSKQFSIKKKYFIIEEFIKRKRYQIAGDGFAWNGKLVFRCFANEHFNRDVNPLVPIGESFPSIESESMQNKIHKEIQRLFDLLNIKQGAFNFDIMIGEDDKIYLMEIGPRNGGNYIPEVIKYATGVDLIAATVESALGNDCSHIKQTDVDGFWSSFIMHSSKDGINRGSITHSMPPQIIEMDEFSKVGDKVNKFNGSNNSLGGMILKFRNKKEMLDMMDHPNKIHKINVE